MHGNRLVAHSAGLALSFLLVACGGGSGGAVTSAPAPTPTPSPTSTPTPTPVAAPLTAPINQTLTTPLSSENFNNLSVRLTEDFTDAGVTANSVTLQGTATTIAYDSATNTYRFSNPSRAPNGTVPDSMTVSRFGSTCNQTPCWNQDPNGASGYLSDSYAFNGGAIRLTYLAMAYWTSTAIDAQGVSHKTTNRAIFGIPTASANIPVSGTATYNLELQGDVSAGKPLVVNGGSGSTQSIFDSRVIGSGTGMFNFASGSFTLAGQIGNGRVFSPTPAGFAATGQITSAASGFTGTMTIADPANPFSGTVQGWFFGPQAQELGALFALTAPASSSWPSGLSLSGAILGSK